MKGEEFNTIIGKRATDILLCYHVPKMKKKKVIYIEKWPTLNKTQPAQVMHSQVDFNLHFF